MPYSTNDVWEVLSTARSVRRCTDAPVDDETLNRAPNGANGQLWRFIVLSGPQQHAAVAQAPRIALGTIEGIYGMSRLAADTTVASPATTAQPTA